MNTIKEILSSLSKLNKSVNEQESDINNMGLNDEEKKEVKSGDYDPLNFEEDDTEDDDYYHEDVE